MQRQVTDSDGHPHPGAPCPRCGGRLVTSHREYAGAGRSRVVQRCSACGHTQGLTARPDAERVAAGGRGRSRRHQPVDEGPPTNPVIDPELARRLLEELGR